MSILGFKLNQYSSNGNKTESFVTNNSIEKTKDKVIWELINYRSENLNKNGISIQLGQYFKIGNQIIKLKMIKIRSSNKKPATSVENLDNYSDN